MELNHTTPIASAASPARQKGATCAMFFHEANVSVPIKKPYPARRLAAIAAAGTHFNAVVFTTSDQLLGP
jgi:hypothetical protein